MLYGGKQLAWELIASLWTDQILTSAAARWGENKAIWDILLCFKHLSILGSARPDYYNTNWKLLKLEKTLKMKMKSEPQWLLLEKNTCGASTSILDRSY